MFQNVVSRSSERKFLKLYMYGLLFIVPMDFKTVKARMKNIFVTERVYQIADLLLRLLPFAVSVSNSKNLLLYLQPMHMH